MISSTYKLLAKELIVSNKVSKNKKKIIKSIYKPFTLRFSVKL